MEKKITKREVINAMLAEEVVVANEVYVNFLNHELELLDKKSSNRKPSKAQEANVAIKDNILAVLTESEAPISATEIAKAVDITVQKASALLRQMIDANVVVKTIDKRKTFFSVA